MIQQKNEKRENPKTRAQLQQEVEQLKKEKEDREKADRQQAAIVAAWARQDPDGTRY